MAAPIPDLASEAGPTRHHVPETVQAFLRRVTRDWHDRVDAAYARYDLQDAGDLTAFLRHQSAALMPIEREIEACGAADFVPDWEQRRRSSAIAADLAQLGSGAASALPVRLPSRLQGIGALYVLEGSKLGARVLLRQVTASPDPRVRSATRFLGHAEPRGWKEFVILLNRLSVSAQVLAELEAGACTAFALFSPGVKTHADPEAISPPSSTLVHSEQA